MAYFAEIDASGMVLRVIVADSLEWCQAQGGTWVQTWPDGSSRKNFAGVGYTYDLSRDAFIPPLPYPSWGLDDGTLRWVPPVPEPDDGKPHVWDEDGGRWT